MSSPPPLHPPSEALFSDSSPLSPSHPPSHSLPAPPLYPHPPQPLPIPPSIIDPSSPSPYPQFPFFDMAAFGGIPFFSPHFYYPGFSYGPPGYSYPIGEQYQDNGCGKMNGDDGEVLSVSDEEEYKKKRVIFSTQQLRALHERYSINNTIKLPERAKFARSIGLTELQVKIWFQNQRYKMRKQGGYEAPRKGRNVAHSSSPDDTFTDGDNEHSTSSRSSRSSPSPLPATVSQMDTHHFPPGPNYSQITAPLPMNYGMGGLGSEWYPGHGYPTNFYHDSPNYPNVSYMNMESTDEHNISV